MIKKQTVHRGDGGRHLGCAGDDAGVKRYKKNIL